MIQENFNADNDESSEQLQRQITATRHRMSETINELGEELNPRHVIESYVDDYSEALVNNLSEKTKEYTTKAAESVKENPLITLALVAGIAWFATRKGVTPKPNARPKPSVEKPQMGL